MHFGFPVVVVNVGEETPDAGIFNYDPVFPTIPLAWLESTITSGDILLCNPSFSILNLGIKLDCLKIMYVQDFKTFKIIDRFFDHYVSVSNFVQAFLLSTYGLQTDVIPPFITIAPEALPPRWEDRPPFSLRIITKDDRELFEHLRLRLRRRLSQDAPGIEQAIAWEAVNDGFDAKIPHQDMCRQFGSIRYLLTLTVAEGFGLMPLEAMAMGTAVLGFDAFGGRHYMRPGENCMARPYPDIDGIAADLAMLIGNPERAATIAAAAARTAADYSYERFCAAWVRKFSAILAPPDIHLERNR